MRRTALNNLGSLWSNLDMRRRIIALGAALAVFAAVIGLTRGAGARDLSLLYAGLDPASAGGVVTALDQRGVDYEVRGDAIYVPPSDRDLLRLALAGEGLPEASSQGYELLNSLSGFGTTAQMFDAAYWRAKEGELARTILSVPGIRTARVHISTPANRPFARDLQATAAVTVAMSGGGTLGADQARALRFLVASAVSGLAPADVAVIDADHGLVAADDAAGRGDSLAEDLRQRALRLLEARVGLGNAVVEVSVETVTETELIRERQIDPDSRIAISTEIEENERTAQTSGAAAVTVASNLPDGDANGANGNSQSADTQTRTITNYELSETSREIMRAPGAIRRMSVAVLVNDIAATAVDGSTALTPRSDQEMQDLRDLVASAVGLDEARGDAITVRSMPFEPVALAGTEGISGGPFLDVMGLIKIGVLAAVALILGLFVLRPILASGRQPPMLAELPAPMPALAGPGADAAAQARQAAAMRDVSEAEVVEAEIVDPVTRLRRLIELRQDETIQILQDWIEEPTRNERA